MNGIKLACDEIKRILSSKMARITIFAVVLVPLLYSSLYLWAFWDPYATLDDMPVAVVNDDLGAEYNNVVLNVGNEIVEKLKNDNSLGWNFISYDEAEESLMDDEYYLIVRIPENFSENIASARDKTPVKAQLEFIPKESHNLLASQLSHAAMTELQLQVSESITAKYLEVLVNAFGDVGEGLNAAGDGVQELGDALISAQEGTSNLTDGMTDLNVATKELIDGAMTVGNGAIQFTDGLQQTADGNKQVASGLGVAVDSLQLMQQSIKPLSEGAEEFTKNIVEVDKATDQLVQGSQKVQTGINTLQTAVDDIYVGSEGIVNGLDASVNTLDDIEARIQNLLEKNPSLKTDESMVILLQELAYLNSNQGISAIASGAEQINLGLKDVKNNIPSLSDGQDQIVNGLTNLDESMVAFSAGANQLGNGILLFDDGVTELHSGISTAVENLNKIVSVEEQMANSAAPLKEGAIALNTGAGQLEAGMSALYSGSIELNSGLTEIVDGSNTLETELYNAASEVASENPGGSQLNLMSSPVELVSKTINPVPNYGTGFAPYFIALGLWVGALVLFLIVDINHFYKKPARALSKATSKYFTLIFIGILQATVATIVLHLALGLEPNNILLFYLFNILFSCVFIAIIQSFVTLLGEAGKFLAIVVLMLQLTSCAGTFPLELTPKFFQVINPVLPMTYGVSALKEIISGNDMSVIYTNSGILLLMGIGAFLVTWLTFKLDLNGKLGTEEKSVTA